jgi:hypothetical protein
LCIFIFVTLNKRFSQKINKSYHLSVLLLFLKNNTEIQFKFMRRCDRMRIPEPMVLNYGCGHRCDNDCGCCDFYHCGCCNVQCGCCGVKSYWNFPNYIKWHHYFTTLFTHNCKVLVYSINTNSNMFKIYVERLLKVKFEV